MNIFFHVIFFAVCFYVGMRLRAYVDNRRRQKEYLVILERPCDMQGLNMEYRRVFATARTKSEAANYVILTTPGLWDIFAVEEC